MGEGGKQGMSSLTLGNGAASLAGGSESTTLFWEPNKERGLEDPGDWNE
jgi:hypothetical protein